MTGGKVRRSLGVAVALGAVLLGGQRTLAAGGAERLAARGLVELHAGRTREALDLFQRAVAADPDDFQALYYRGVTRGRAGDLDGAVADLQSVLEKKPDWNRAALESGIALTQLERYRDAIPMLTRARTDPDLATDAAFFLGLAHWRLGKVEPARRELSAAAREAAPTELAAHYYLGLIEFQAGASDKAQAHLSRVATLAPGTPMAREANELLDRLGQKPRPYRLNAVLGLQYDSNVVLAPADDTLKDTNNISDEDDARFTISAGGNVTAWHDEYVQLVLGYDFFQSLHFELGDFNIQDHRASGQLSGNIGILTLGLQGQFDYVFLEDDAFLSQGSVLPWLSVDEGSYGSLDVFYRLRGNDFHKEPYNGLRDARNHSVGARQTLRLREQRRTLSFGYRYDKEDPYSSSAACAPGSTSCPVGPDAYAYDGHELSFGLAWPLPAQLLFDVGYAYRRESYDERASGGRIDKESLVTVALHKTITANFSVTAGYVGDFNDSSDERFEYRRHIASLALEARY